MPSEKPPREGVNAKKQTPARELSNEEDAVLRRKRSADDLDDFEDKAEPIESSDDDGFFHSQTIEGDF
jgi:hypothetical protein